MPPKYVSNVIVKSVATMIASMTSALAASQMPELDGAVAWINSRPVDRQTLRGKVVLVQFWTYTCINWRRTMPYIRAWAEKYEDDGLVVIGVHTPEFDFEADVSNVRHATRQIDIRFPIAVDSDYAIWRAFENEYWPALYLIDARGRIRYTQFGEGDYDASEQMIQQLLNEAGRTVADNTLARVEGRGPEAPADWKSLRSPETYLGYERTANFASPSRRRANTLQTYAFPAQLKLNEWALKGQWTMQRHSVVLNQSGGRIVYRFHARDVHLVMGSVSTQTSVRFRVRIDGKPPGVAHGVDVDENGDGVIRESRMYQLIRQPTPIETRQIEIEFLDAGAQLFDFTFG